MAMIAARRTRTIARRLRAHQRQGIGDRLELGHAFGANLTVDSAVDDPVAALKDANLLGPRSTSQLIATTTDADGAVRELTRDLGLSLIYTRRLPRSTKCRYGL